MKYRPKKYTVSMLGRRTIWLRHWWLLYTVLPFHISKVLRPLSLTRGATAAVTPARYARRSRRTTAGRLELKLFCKRLVKQQINFTVNMSLSQLILNAYLRSSTSWGMLSGAISRWSGRSILQVIIKMQWVILMIYYFI